MQQRTDGGRNVWHATSLQQVTLKDTQLTETITSSWTEISYSDFAVS